MPSWRPGPPASLQAAARRWLKSVPRWRTTSKPGGSHGPGSPSRARTLRAAPQAATAASVSARAASATAAASSGEHGGQRRVFTRPGRGSLAMTRTWGSRVRRRRFMRGAGPCPGWPGPFPAAFPSPSMLPDRGAYGTATSSMRQPAAAARSTISSGQPKRRSRRSRPSRASRRAARIGPRSDSRCPVRRRSSSASRRLAARAWIGQAAVVVGRRAPRTRSADPARTGPATAGRSRGSREPSPSMKQTTPSGGSAASSPAQQAAPNPGVGSWTTRAPAARARSPEPSVEPLSTTSGR